MMNKEKLIKDLNIIKEQTMNLLTLIDKIIEKIDKSDYNTLNNKFISVDEFYEEYTNKHSEDIKT